MVENRRSARIQARLWIKVAGVDDELQLRRGDFSLTGLFFETDVEVGGPGSVQSLTIAPFSKKNPIEVMARIVRVVTVNDIWRGQTISGVGMEFMADGTGKRRVLKSFVERLVGGYLKEGDSAADYLLTSDSSDDGAGMHLERLGNDGMLLETSWPVTPGETIRCEIHAPASGRRLRIEGTATAVTPISGGGARSRVEVKFNNAGNPPRPDEIPVHGTTLDDALAGLLEETMVLQTEDLRRRAMKRDLTGTLDRIQMGGLLTFIEMERMTGVLFMASGASEAQLVIRDGQVLDVTSSTVVGTPFDMLAELLEWRDGEFRFSVRDVPDSGRLDMTTTALLMELARIDDEARR